MFFRPSRGYWVAYCANCRVLQYPPLQKYIRSGLHIGSGCGPPELICQVFILSVFLYFVTITFVVDSWFYNFWFFILTQGPLGWEYWGGMVSFEKKKHNSIQWNPFFGMINWYHIFLAHTWKNRLQKIGKNV